MGSSLQLRAVCAVPPLFRTAPRSSVQFPAARAACAARRSSTQLHAVLCNSSQVHEAPLTATGQLRVAPHKSSTQLCANPVSYTHLRAHETSAHL
eukprot:11823826-Alexandrium_andersonii.AAC.1